MKKKALLLGAAVLAGYSLLPTALYRGRAMVGRGNGEKVLYLTFDDGPSEYTPFLLDLLKSYEIKASFFTVAEAARRYPAIIQRMQAEGHLVGCHSLRHKNQLWQSPGNTAADFAQAAGIMEELGVSPTHYRPPWGCLNQKTIACMKAYGYTPVLWQVMAEDWQGDTTALAIGEKLLRRTKNGDIICLHDGRGENAAPHRTIEGLKLVLPLWQRAGYRFLRVDEV